MSEMIVITGVDYFIAHTDPAWMDRRSAMGYDEHPVFRNNNPSNPRVHDAEIKRELIHGKRFVTTRLRDVNQFPPPENAVVDYEKETWIEQRSIHLGASKEVQNLLSPALDGFQEDHNRFNAAHRSNNVLKSRIEAFKSAGFWTRLKWLFTGVKEG